MPVPAPTTPCPCGTGRAYAACCGRWHADPAATPDAEALMRSRYSAYALGLTDHLRATWAPETCPDELDAAAPGRRWLGLDVQAHRVQDADHATVRFVARCKAGGGRAERLQELSRFERRGGRWLYVDGDVDADRPPPR